MFKKLGFILAFIPTLLIAQQTIKGNFSPAKDYKWVILYKATPTTSIYIDNVEVDEKGDFELQLDSTVTQGMYKLVYALPQEENNFDIIYNAKENIEFSFNQETGIQFTASIENQLVASYTNSMAFVSQSIGNFFQQQSTDTLALASIFETQRKTQTEYEEISEETVASHFIKANRPYIPNEFEDIKTYINNLKIHFFDNVDFNNETLQSSNFLIERTLNYVFGMSSETDDDTTAYKNNIDDIFEVMKDANPLIKATLLEVLWQQMVDANFDDVANHISDNYLIDLAKSLNNVELEKNLILFKNLSIGASAPDFSWETEEEGKLITQKLSEFEVAQNYIIVFWSSTCSHCLKEIPQLQTLVNTFEEGQIKVIAIGLEDESYRWKSETYNYPEFTHVLGLGKWDNEIGNAYNVNATPTYFVLDKDKKIISKPYDFEALKKLFEK